MRIVHLEQKAGQYTDYLLVHILLIFAFLP